MASQQDVVVLCVQDHRDVFASSSTGSMGGREQVMEHAIDYGQGDYEVRAVASTEVVCSKDFWPRSSDLMGASRAFLAILIVSSTDACQ
ncbi:hypothetical protein Y032_1097g3600 [Ancylostoma ceylanicum]|uniref:Uncharacterized protein n=1 Tax=Ancylostoma ceylanicum TaxID=53326 RepID=A0A016W8B7_9BILA|nr:hypothetical protein Y032_1097g3600 [Ancylostoma ceylanicum]